MDPSQDDFHKQLAERFKQLPQVVQDAIMAANVDQRLREVAATYKLHIDEWDALENEVMLTLLGFERPEDLEKNIQSHTSVSPENARILAENINKIVFQPIRDELERQLQHPEAHESAQTGVEATRTQMLGAVGDGSNTPAPQPTAPAVQPATPPAPKPDTNVVRTPASDAYVSGQPSSARVSVEDDPYREPPK